MRARGLIGLSVLCLLLTGKGLAASLTLRPGEIRGISEDLVLAGDDVLEVRGTAEQPCRLDANGHHIRTSPDAAEKDNYALTVEGKTERVDAGFARHDVPAGGAQDAQAEPKFKGPIPDRFPFSDDDIRARKVGVAKILAHYRDAYAPGEGSPLLNAGDPVDGEGSSIGAVGAGARSPNDYFGRPAVPLK
jgi:hypothetical protein